MDLRGHHVFDGHVHGTVTLYHVQAIKLFRDNRHRKMTATGGLCTGMAGMLCGVIPDLELFRRK